MGAIALALVACGGGSSEPRRPPRPGPLTATEVAARFERLTGDRLRREDRRRDYEILDLATRNPADASRASFRYGSFELYVFGSFEAAREWVARGAGRSLPATREGIYWERFGTQWEARKAFGNVMLTWVGGSEKRTDERWERLVRILEALRRPPGSPGATLPPEERPCDQAGIDPVRGREGTCKLGRQTLVVVNRDTRLDVPGLAIEDMQVRIGEEIGVQGRAGTLARAKGTFVYLRFRLTNKGRRRLFMLFSRLRVGERAFDPSGTGALFRDDLPLAPGETGEATVVFDIPRRLGREARTHGGLEVAGDRDPFVTVDDATVVGRVRLAR